MAQPSARTAIDILSELKDKTDTGMLAYFATPNTVLTLSGSRGFCDGIYYHKDQKVLEKWTKETAEALKLISHNFYHSEAYIDKNPGEDYFSGYDIISKEGLKNSFEQTVLIGDEKCELLNEELSGEQLMDVLKQLLSKHKDLQDLSNDYLYDIAFGIQLGYPDKAILGYLKTLDERDKFAEPVIDADIRGADYYWCPQPLYMYPRHLVNDPEINAHEKLWSSILKEFYTSEFHESLAKDPKFKAMASELGLL